MTRAKYSIPAAAVMLVVMATALLWTTGNASANNDQPGKPTDLTATATSHDAASLLQTADAAATAFTDGTALAGGPTKTRSGPSTIPEPAAPASAGP